MRQFQRGLCMIDAIFAEPVEGHLRLRYLEAYRLASAANRYRQMVRMRADQHQQGIAARFLQRLQQAVRRLCRHPVSIFYHRNAIATELAGFRQGFVHVSEDIDLDRQHRVAAGRGWWWRRFEQAEVGVSAGTDQVTAVAVAACDTGSIGPRAQQRLCQFVCALFFTGAFRPLKQQRMRQPILLTLLHDLLPLPVLPWIYHFNRLYRVV